MPAPRSDQLSQRLLVPILKRAIDLYENQPQDRTAARRIEAIVQANPHSVWGSHVQVNLGKHRRAVLSAILARGHSYESISDETPVLTGTVDESLWDS